MIRIYRYCKDHGVTFVELAILDQINQQGYCFIDDLAVLMKSTRTPVYMHLHRLTKKGLIESHYPYGNKHSRQVSLAADGRRLVRFLRAKKIVR